MAWTIELHPDVVKQLGKLAKRDKGMARRITDYLAGLGGLGDPRASGKALTGPLAGLWRYRVGDWRIVADVHDARCVVVALDVEHRSKAYRS